MLWILLRAIRSTLHAASPGAPETTCDIQIGAVSFLHPFGSSLNGHFHYHVVVLDGVFSEAGDSKAPFHEVSELEPRHWQELQHTVQRRVLRIETTGGLRWFAESTDCNGERSGERGVRLRGGVRFDLWGSPIELTARPPLKQNE